jgi:putative toxin-antitoxin system antitoxin component (TIGR02293 family)
MRFARLWSRAIDVFENDKGARDWLKQPALGLGGRIPLEAAKTETGAHEVDVLLQRIDYGVP